MLRIAICDDEQYYLDKIEKAVKDNLHAQGISSYEITTYLSGLEIYQHADKLIEYDAIFLDISMPEISGLEIARKIRESNSNVLLVFITSFLNYSPEGYKFEVTRFLLKNILDDILPECIETIIKKLKIQGMRMEFVFCEGKKEIFIDQIYFIESQRHKLTFHIKEQPLLQYNLYDKLDNIEAELGQYGFLRIHKSYLINLKYISEIANYKAKLMNGSILPIPREKFQKIKEKYYELAGEWL